MTEVHIFRTEGRIFGCTARSSGDNLPAGQGEWTPFKTVSMTRGESMPGIDVNECLDDIEKYGFHVTEAHKRITERFVSST